MHCCRIYNYKKQIQSSFSLWMQWLNHGGDITNQRNAIRTPLINPFTVRNLKLKWKFLAGFDITATPAVANGVVYFPSWNGNLYAVNAVNGVLIWKQNLTQITRIPPTGRYVNVTVSRSTPVVAGDILIVGIYGPAYVVAVRRSTGELLWSTRVDPLPLSLVTASGTVYLGLVKFFMQLHLFIFISQFKKTKNNVIHQR